jgi:hypothetical protein
VLEETHLISRFVSDLELRCRTKYATLNEDKHRDRGLIWLQGEKAFMIYDDDNDDNHDNDGNDTMRMTQRSTTVTDRETTL